MTFPWIIVRRNKYRTLVQSEALWRKKYHEIASCGDDYEQKYKKLNDLCRYDKSRLIAALDENIELKKENKRLKSMYAEEFQRRMELIAALKSLGFTVNISKEESNESNE